MIHETDRQNGVPLFMAFEKKLRSSCWCIGNLLRYLDGLWIRIFSAIVKISLRCFSILWDISHGHCIMFLPASAIILLMYWRSLEISWRPLSRDSPLVKDNLTYMIWRHFEISQRSLLHKLPATMMISLM